MKKFFLSIFVGIFILGINFGYAGYIGGEKGKQLQVQARKNLKLLENVSGRCKKEVDGLIVFCENTYPSLKGKKCLTKMLSDGKAGPVTLRVLHTETKCATNSLVNAKVLSRRNVVEKFCSMMSSYKRIGNNLGWVDAKNSFFLKILCNTTGIYTDNKFKKRIIIPKNEKKYYSELVEDARKNSLIDFGLFGKCKNTDGINTDPNSLNNVNFVCVANDIWNKLASDEINLGTYIVYGGFSDKNGLIEWEKNFFYGAKSTKGEIICPKGYITQNSNDGACKHPETYSMIEATQGDLKQMIGELNFFKDIKSVGSIMDYLTLNGCKNDNSCNYPLMTLKDSLYNELYFYVYFLSYYGNEIKNNTSYLQGKTVGSNITNVNLNTAKELVQAQKSIIVARLSIKKSFDLLKNIYWTYPIHVGFLAIIEDFKKLRKSLAYIYTPIDQLRYKLQNVQDLSKE